MSRTIISLTILLAIILIAASCGGNPTSSAPTITSTTNTVSSPSTVPSGSADSPKYGGTLRIASTPLTPTIGWPANMSASAAGTIMQVCLETLLRQDSKGNIVPWLAESYKVADDLKSITFNLRKGVKFHDGSDFTAEVAKWNLENYIKARLEPNWSSIEVIDDYTVRVNLTKWTSLTPADFGDAVTGIYFVSRAAYDKNGLDWVKANPVGTGPFKFVKYNPDVKVEFIKYPDYWKTDAQGNKLPYLDGIEFIIAPAIDTRANMLLIDEADLSDVELGGQSYSQLESKGFKFVNFMSMTMCLIPDTANAGSPWTKKEVREAAEYAIDRAGLAVGLGKGLLQPTYQIPPRISMAYNPDFKLGREYNIEKAKELLASAGYPDGFKTTMIVSPMGVNRDYNVALQDYFAKIGIQTELDFPEAGRFMGYIGKGKWPDNSIMYMGFPSIEPTYAGGIQFAFNMIGTSWERTPELTQAIEDALASPSVNIEKIRGVTNIITRDALIIPVSEAGGSESMQPYVMNTGYSDRGSSNFWNSEQVWFNK
jgi:peptide/nickel transport system substrate-binding protein